MARPIKWRRIENIPRYQHFKPFGQDQNAGENRLKIEELEALRLKDLEGLEQEACAQRMEVSRPTFQRILISAREKVADSLVHGKSIRIEGGNYTRGICPVRCLDCGHVWEESIEKLEEADSEYTCPDCQSQNLECCPEDFEHDSGRTYHCWGACRRQGFGRGQGRGFGRGRRV